MSILPLSALTASDLSALGTNVVQAARHERAARREPPPPSALPAANRSLAGQGEAVDRLYRGRPRPRGCGGRRSVA